MEEKNLIDLVTIIIATISVVVTIWTVVKAWKEENIKHLLGEKETVGFAAIKIFNKGLPWMKNRRQEVISAILQACLFERSDRARALLFRVIEANREEYPNEFANALKELEKTNESMQTYNFTKAQLNRESAELRISAIRMVVNNTKNKQIIKFETIALPTKYSYLAPDGSEIRLLPTMSGGGLAHCILPANGVSAPVYHKTVEEIWYFIEGKGQVWRKQNELEDVTEVHQGLSLAIPVDTHFQFRNTGDIPLQFIIATIPPWPGENEAVKLSNGRW